MFNLDYISVLELLYNRHDSWWLTAWFFFFFFLSLRWVWDCSSDFSAPSRVWYLCLLYQYVQFRSCPGESTFLIKKFFFSQTPIEKWFPFESVNLSAVYTPEGDFWGFFLFCFLFPLPSCLPFIWSVFLRALSKSLSFWNLSVIYSSVQKFVHPWRKWGQRNLNSEPNK